MRKKILHNQKGESIAEVLVAGLVIALGVILAVSLINAGNRMIRNSENDMYDFYNDINLFEENPTPLGKRTIQIQGDNSSVTTVWYYCTSMDRSVKYCRFQLGS